MPELDFNILTVVRALDEADEGRPLLVEGLLYPEACCLDRHASRGRVTLRTALKHVIEKRLKPQALQTRGIGVTPEVKEVTLELQPPPRNEGGWSGPVSLRFHVIRWRHGDEATIAYVPALEIEVSAANPDELDARLDEQIRFALRRTKIAASLYRLALLDRVRGVRLEPLELSATVKDPKQRAQEHQREDEPKAVIESAGSVLTAPGTSLPPAYEVDAVVAQLADALGGHSPRSVLLVGPSGVGKTAVLRELVRTRDRFGFAQTPFWSTSGARLVAGMSGFGMWQKRVGQLVKEATKAGAILHLANLIELMEVGRSVMVGQGIASFLRPHIGRGDVLVVAECTPEQLPIIERADPHLLAVFRQVVVEEPSRETGARILRSFARERVGPTDATPIADAALDTLDRLHRRYAGYSAYPGRPLRFLHNLLVDRAERTAAWPTAADVTTLHSPPGQITADDVTAAFARETGLPRFMLDESAPLDLAASREWFAARVIGQGETVDLVADLLATVKVALNRPRRPIASLLFIGPTGVGKTEMAKTLAEFFFSDRSRVTRFDMSEYASPAAVARLVGAVSAGGEGLLTAKVREQPFGVILLDEFEKADASLFDLMLQVLGEGRLTDAPGRVADFTNAIIIMTSNLGAESFSRGGFGLRPPGESASGAKGHFVEAVRDFFRPELFNRIDRVVPFAPLGRATIAAVTRRELDLVARRDGVKLRGVELTVGDAAVDHLAAAGFDIRYGARPLKRAIERELLVPLAEALNTYPEQSRLVASVDAVGEPRRLTVTVRAKVDASGRQASAMASGSAVADLARRASVLRRQAQYLDRSSGVLAMRNELFRIRQAERRRHRRAKHKHVPFYADRAGRMKRLTDVNDALAQVIERTIAVEDALLTSIYEGEHDKAAKGKAPADAVAELARLEAERSRIPLALYALRFDDPDVATLAIYCEHTRPLLRLARAYHAVTLLLNGEVKLSWLRRKELEKRGTSDKERFKIERLDERDAAAFLAGDHVDVVGIFLTIRCANAAARFESEPGLHVVKDNAGEATCRVEAVTTPLDRYAPPDAVGTRGWITPGPTRRGYDLKNRVLHDPNLGDEPFANVPLEQALLRSIEFAMNETVWAAIEGKT
jgi:ATP-dependent Clp protease ATP-binding subunit ClpA